MDQRLVKRVGRIQNLRDAVDEAIPAFAGIGHSRWATHGPTLKTTLTLTNLSGRFTLIAQRRNRKRRIEKEYLATISNLKQILKLPWLSRILCKQRKLIR